MEIHNFVYGVLVRNDAALNSPVDYFYPKNVGRVFLTSEDPLLPATFNILDTLRYQPGVSFTRPQLTALSNGGVPVPVPGTDAALFDLLCSYFYQAAIFSPVNNFAPINNFAPVNNFAPINNFAPGFAPVNNNNFSPTIFLDPAPKLVVVPISGAAYAPVLGDNGKYFVFDTPVAAKTFTIASPTLPVGWYCWLIKAYVGNTITIAGSGGMVPVGPDLILNNQWSVAKIVVIAATQAHVQNVGG